MERPTRVVACLLVALCVMFSGCGDDNASNSQQLRQQTSHQNTASLPNFVHLVKTNSASVVNISSSHKVATSRSDLGRSMRDMFKQLFGDRFGDQFDDYFGGSGAHPKTQNVRSLGSGFVLSDDGYILTNYHVIAGADSIVVRFNDRRELKAKLIGKDKPTDVALLKVNAKHLSPVKIGSSTNLQVGEWVAAIGAPFGFDSTVTKGIVSAKSRNLPNESYVPFIQTDVPINPGNSGGPLFNLAGEVVGINSQIISRSGGYMGLSFAVPIDLAMKVVDQLKAGKQVQRGWLGVAIQEVTHELADNFDLDRPMGALVASVTAGSPAAKAGLKNGDIIVSFDNRVVNRSAQLPPMVGVTPPGIKVTLDIIRAGKSKTLTVTLGQLPTNKASTKAKQQDKTVTTVNRWGLGVTDFNAKDTEKQSAHGVKVVKASGPAAAAGVRDGDVVLSVNNQTVGSVSEFNRQLANHKDDKQIVLLVRHNKTTGFVVLHQQAE